MDDYQRIEEILKYLNSSARAFALSIGLKSPQMIYDIKAGKCGISKDLAGKIKEKYVNINKSWLLTGEGEMLNTPSDTIEPDKVQSDVITIPANVWSVIEQQANSLTARDRQMDELISIIKEQVKKTNARPEDHAISAVAG